MTIGDNLRKYRKEAGLTQVELAKRLGILQGNITRWETDKVIPSVPTLEKLSKILNVSIGNFLLTERRKKNLKVGDQELLEKLNEAGQLSPEDRAMLVNMIDTLKLKSRLNSGQATSYRNPSRPC